MIVAAYIWYFIRLCFYPPRIIWHLFHRFLVFLTKPAAPVLLAIFTLLFGFANRAQIVGLFGPAIDDIFRLEGDTEAAFWVYRVEIAIVASAWLSLIALTLGGRMFRPIISAFPAPRLPMPPMIPLIVREHEIKTKAARVALPARRMSRFKGDLRELYDYLPPDMRAILEDERAEAAREAEREAEREAKRKAKRDKKSAAGGAAPKSSGWRERAKQEAAQAASAPAAAAQQPEQARGRHSEVAQNKEISGAPLAMAMAQGPR